MVTVMVCGTISIRDGHGNSGEELTFLMRPSTLKVPWSLWLCDICPVPLNVLGEWSGEPR